MRIDTSGIDYLLEELEQLGRDVEPIVEKTLKRAAVTVRDATILALNKTNLPAQGKYSTGLTERNQVIRWPKIERDGTTVSVRVGLDFDEAGAGGYLMAGTPKMKPDKELRKIYRGATFKRKLLQEMHDTVVNELEKEWDQSV